MAQPLDAAQLIADDKQYVWHHLTQHKVFEKSDPTIFVEGKGMRIKDIHGKEYLDAVSGGVWTVNLGYANETLAKAVSDQLMQLCYFANGYGNIPTIQFSKKLIEKMPGMSRVYLSNSGSEANEKAFKIVRQISQLKHGGKKYKVVFRNRDYHGTTITTLSACGQEERKNQYGPFTPGFVEFPACSAYRSPYPAGTANLGEKFARELETVVQKEDPDTVGAVIIEPITAGGGVIVPPEGYYETLTEICKKYGLLLIIDEVVCGLGRTGKWFGYQHFNVKPDIVTMAKGVAAGYAPRTSSPILPTATATSATSAPSAAAPPAPPPATPPSITLRSTMSSITSSRWASISWTASRLWKRSTRSSAMCAARACSAALSWSRAAPPRNPFPKPWPAPLWANA